MSRPEAVQELAKLIGDMAPELSDAEVAAVLGLTRQRWSKAQQNGVKMSTLRGWLERWRASGREPIEVAEGPNWAKAWRASSGGPTTSTDEIQRPDLGRGVVEVRQGHAGTWTNYYAVSLDGTRWIVGFAASETERPAAEESVRTLLSGHPSQA